VITLRLKKATYRHIEAEIYHYHDTLRAMQELRTAIIMAADKPELAAIVGGRFAGTSIVERRATKLADSILLKEMERITTAISDVYAKMREDCREVLWVKYRLRIGDWTPSGELRAVVANKHADLNPDEIAAILHIDRVTYFRHRNRFIYGVAERLGWY